MHEFSPKQAISRESTVLPVLPGFARFCPVFLGVLPGFARFCPVLPGFARFSGVCLCVCVLTSGLLQFCRDSGVFESLLTKFVGFGVLGHFSDVSQILIDGYALRRVLIN